MKLMRLASAVLIVAAAAGCSDDQAVTTNSGSTSSTAVSGTTSTTEVAVTSTTTPATTAASTSTSSSTTSSTSSTSTTTTLPPGAELVLRANGLGTAAFGADPDGVVAYVSSIIGPPTTDSEWVDPLAVGACPGNEFRQVTWGDLTLQFTDESNATSGRRHFFSYIYGPSLGGAPISPAGLKTDAGIGIGSTVAELTGTYPTAIVNPGDDFAGPNYFINLGLAGFLSGATPTDTVASVLGGQGCGE